MGPYLAVFGVTAAAVAVVTPVVRWVAVKLGAIDRPSDRKVHPKPTPTGGGLGILAGVLIGLGVAYFIPSFRSLYRQTLEIQGTIFAALVITAVGLFDDLRALSAPAKTAGQVLAAGLLILNGVELLFFWFPSQGVISMGADLAVPLTIAWVLIMVNAVNLIDGLDGLAAGIVAIAAAAFFVYGDRLSNAGLLPPENVGPLIAVVACGVCLGFLPHNFHPARMFMGDAGSMLLGLLMASSTMMVGGRTADQFSGQTYFFFAPIFIPLFVLGVPILDTVFAIVRRSVRRAGVSTPDKEHLHHRLMRLGHGHRRSVVILWIWTAILSGLVLLPTFTNEGQAVIPFAGAGLLVALYTLFHPGVRQRAEAEAEARAEADQAAEAAAPPKLADVVELADRRREADGA
jgi:UDP-GlcNAc:undecaprenyl-phosphate/decaprenyl-phosphate GlcNAc-1-phosphate transferase